MVSPYQDVWRDGHAVTAGERDCAGRYTVIRGVLDRIDEPFTMLDIGAHAGYFSVRTAEDYNCRVTAVDNHPALRVRSDRVTVVPRRVDADWLPAQPRVDVVLALSVLHHMPDWRRVLAEIAACRHTAVVEIPHPDETWMRSAAARHEVPELHEAVLSAGKQIGESERVGRDGVTYVRPIVAIPGRVQRLVGTVFAGSGSNSRKMRQFGTGLDDALGYEPFWGSLNLRMSHAVRFGEPWLDWLGRDGTRTRDYQFWRAWIGGLPCHAMIPGARNHGPDCAEIVAPVKLRDRLGLADGDTVTVDVETDPL